MLLAAFAGGAAATDIVDATGRPVVGADPAPRVRPAGPPAAALVLALRPEARPGWWHGLRDADRALLPAAARDLPELPDADGTRRQRGRRRRLDR